MISLTRHCRSAPGATLVESVIAVGVLAVAVPLVFGSLAEAGKNGASAQAETRSAWIVPACMAEIQASRDGRPQFFTSTAIGQPFPAAGDVWALAFSADGRPLGRVGRSLYENGLKELAGEPVRFIAVLSAVAEPPASGATPMLSACISIEYPSSAPAARRGKIDFNTRIP
jgi:Tfp pilus assembly protein PilV